MAPGERPLPDDVRILSGLSAVQLERRSPLRCTNTEYLSNEVTGVLSFNRVLSSAP